MKDKHKQAFQNYASKLIEEFDTVEKVVLFGSVARGDYGVNSDVDVLISVKDLSERESIEDLAYEITSQTGVSISPLVVEKSLEEKDIIKTIENEGERYVRS